VADYSEVPRCEDMSFMDTWAASGHDMSLMIAQPGIVHTHYVSPSGLTPVWLVGPHPEMSHGDEMLGLLRKMLQHSGVLPGSLPSGLTAFVAAAGF